MPPVFAYFYFIEVKNPLAIKNSISNFNTSSQDPSIIGKYNFKLFKMLSPNFIYNINIVWFSVFADFYYMEVQNALTNEKNTSNFNTSSQDVSLIGK